MASFFQHIIDLGEEKPASAEATDSRSSEELTKMPRDELIAAVRRLEGQLQEKERARKQIEDDALSLQSQFEAYKKKVDTWQQHMKESRAADKKMIDELRAAGTTGKIDDAFVKSTNDTIANLKQSLREAQDDAAKAFRRQREAEETRAAFERSSRHEMDDLSQKLSQMRERMKTAHERSEQQLSQLLDDNATLREQLLHAEHRGGAGSGGATHPEKAVGTPAGKEPLLAVEGSVQSHPEYVALQQKYDALVSTKDSSGAVTEGGEAESTAPIRAGDSSASLEVVTSLKKEVEELRAAESANNLREADLQQRLRRAEEKGQRLEQDGEWEKVEADKKLAELRSTAESLKAKLQQAEARLESKEETIRQAERQHTRAVRDLEDLVAAEKEKYAALLRRAEEKEQFLEEQLQQAKERIAVDNDKAGAAEELTKQSAEALDTQRMHFDGQLAQRDTRIQELYAARQALEVAAQESLEDKRRLEDEVREARRREDSQDEALRAAEASMADLQRTLSAREEALCDRERERQSLRSRLAQEEHRAADLHGLLRDMELRVGEADAEARRREQQLTRDQEAEAKLRDALDQVQQQLASQSTVLKVRDAQLADTHRKLQDLGLRNADILRLKEDHTGAVRAYERRIAELEKAVQAQRQEALSSTAGTASATASVPMNPFEATMEKRRAVLDLLSHAKRSSFQSLSAAQLRLIIFGGLIFIVMLSIINGLRYFASGAGGADIETFELVREKYAQTLTSLTSCQETLTSLRSASTAK